MVTLSDVVAGIGLAIVGGVLLAGRIASAGPAGRPLPGGAVVLGAVGALLAALLVAGLVVRTRSR